MHLFRWLILYLGVSESEDENTEGGENPLWF